MFVVELPQRVRVAGDDPIEKGDISVDLISGWQLERQRRNFNVLGRLTYIYRSHK